MKPTRSTQPSDLFGDGPKEASAESLRNAPLAVRMRPTSINEIIGQDHILGEGKLLRRVLQSDRIQSMIFYGPPGVGKTTFAQLISKSTNGVFVPLNAVSSNVAELRKVITTAKKQLRHQGLKTILFIDEIHRFNKSQQDVLMPEVETGQVILVGATTHNPSFSINGPLLSRSTVFELRPLEDADLIKVMERALNDSAKGYGEQKVKMEDGALKHLAKAASGDARRVLNSLEVGILTTQPDADGVIHFTKLVAEESSQRRVVYYDADEDYHYDTISAFIKSMRGSDPDAAVYWLAKMLYGGEDPRFIVRRIMILASEDIGNADPRALILATSGMQAIEFVGMPEARIILSQLVTYMALAPKSNASYEAIDTAMADVKNESVKDVPDHLRSAAYPGAKKLGHGQGYVYPHGTSKDALPVVEQKYVPQNKRYYHPKATAGYERELSERLKAVLQKKNTT